MTYVFATLFKETIESKVGLKLRKVGDDIQIINIHEGSMASFTKLKPGMIILNINNQPMVGKEGKDALRKLRDALGEIWIVAQRNGVEDIPMANIFIGSIEIMNQNGLSDEHVMRLSTMNVNTLEDLMLLNEKEDFDTIFGSDDESTFMVKKKLAALSKFLRNGGSISDNSITKIVQYNENVEAKAASIVSSLYRDPNTYNTSRPYSGAVGAGFEAVAGLAEAVQAFSV